MVLCQIYITPGGTALPTANGKYQVVPVTGKCSIRVLNMVYHDTAGANTHRLIQLVSDNLVFPYSPCRYLSLISNPVATLNYDVSYRDYSLYNTVLNGQLLLQVIDNATGVEPVNFTECLVSLDIEMIDKVALIQ